MKEQLHFICASTEYNTFDRSVPAPYIRKSVQIDRKTTATLTVAACGFYELYVNGNRCTKGFLAPYISNPDDYIYCDRYEISLEAGENIIGLWLGNGFQNNPGGYIWDFDKAPYRSAPMVAVMLCYRNADGNEIIIESDSSFLTHPSPILSDDYRFGETYDARKELDGWNAAGFDDSDWAPALEVCPPRGEIRLCEAEPLVKETELKPIAITKEGDGWLYRFPRNDAGVCRLQICGTEGQEITLRHGELILNNRLTLENIWFPFNNPALWERDKTIVHKDTYICKGQGKEIYTPTFVYHGFSFVLVEGITPEQATEDLLTFVVFHSDLRSRGSFTCSDPKLNALQEMVRRSDLSNFHYFPTDCPHREKNGWTADAALSAEQLLLNFTPEVSYREWLRNICKAQNADGALPGIIPTSGWGFAWGNGPAWDCILVYLPYYVYRYRGETAMIRESAASLLRYLHYLTTQKDEKGLIHIGLGDWCHVGDITPKAPLALTDTVMSMDIAQKAAVLFDAIGMSAQHDFAQRLATELRATIRSHLIDFKTMTVEGNCQTCQAMCLAYGVFEGEERPVAMERLLEMIHREDDHMDVGVLGARVLFHVLSEFGYSDLAYHMITRPDGPSYGFLLEQGATTLWENFPPKNGRVNSANHHFWGDISAWFIKELAGIHYNPTARHPNELTVAPHFIKALDFADGSYTAPQGKIRSRWERKENNILLALEIPKGIDATVLLPSGICAPGHVSPIALSSGTHSLLLTQEP